VTDASALPPRPDPKRLTVGEISFPRVDRSKGSGGHDDRAQERDVRSDCRHGGGRRRPAAAAVLRGTAEVIEDPAGRIAGELVCREGKEGVEFTGSGAWEMLIYILSLGVILTSVKELDFAVSALVSACIVNLFATVRGNENKKNHGS